MPAKSDDKVERPTTKDDATDVGVDMLPGDPDTEPTGPEDALGVGPKRGDYSDRIGPSNYHPHEVVRDRDAKAGEPQVKVEAQRPRVEDRGDVAGRKGGVDSAQGPVK